MIDVANEKKAIANSVNYKRLSLCHAISQFWLVLLPLTIAFHPAHAFAQSYPTKAIRVIDGFAPGGSTDIAARLIAPKFQENSGQPWVIDSRPGAQGIIGADVVAKAAPDGYTLLMFPASWTTQTSLQRNLPFDLTKSFAPVAQISTTTIVLVVHPSVPAQTVKGLTW